MKTIVKSASDAGALEMAADIIKRGGLVAFPTETVYGLGGNALDAAACAKIYAAKGRPSDNPLISHIADIDMLSQIVENVPRGTKILMDKFWPGPLTIIFPALGGGTVGVRMPENAVALRFIRLCGVPVAAPSANVSGRPSPTSASHVLADLDGKIDMILDGGGCKHGLESTVIDCTVTPPVILRPGAVTKEMIEAEIGPVGFVTEAGDDAPKAPGMKYRHYAPKAKLTVVVGEQVAVNAKILQLAASAKHPKFAIMAATQNLNTYVGYALMDMGENPQKIAAGLFEKLRLCDEMGLDEVFVEGVAENGLGTAIMNRLKKAASYNIIDAK